jgi:hypothetical protein
MTSRRKIIYLANSVRYNIVDIRSIFHSFVDFICFRISIIYYYLIYFFRLFSIGVVGPFQGSVMFSVVKKQNGSLKLLYVCDEHSSRF